MTEQPEPPKLDEEALRARKRRNLWLALALGAFVILVAATTMIRISQTGMGPEQEFYWHADD